MINCDWTPLLVYDKYGQNGQIILLVKIFGDLPLFWNYILMYIFFETRVCHVIRVLWKKKLSSLSYYFYRIRVLRTQVIRQIWWLFFIEFKLHGKLEFHKLEFHKFEFQKSGRILIFSQIILNRQIFQQKMIFYHFNLTSTTYTIFVFVKNLVAQPKPPNIFYQQRNASFK